MKEFVEKLIGRLKNRIEYNELCHKEFPNAKMSFTYEVQINAYKNVIEIVNQLAEEMGVSKMEDTTWIPCSERLPEENTEVRIKFDNGKEFQGGIDENGWYLGSKDIMFDYFDQICLREDIKIVAWKYL